jgi:hypothetical protein
MMLLSFILLVLFIAGIIGTAIQLFAGPNINNQCNTYVFNDSQDGPTLDTLAFLQQRNICKCFHVLKYNMGTNDYNRSMLAGRVRLLDRRKRVPDLDDGYGESGQFESVLVMIVKRLLSAKLWHFFVHFSSIGLCIDEDTAVRIRERAGLLLSISGGVQACLRDTEA